MLECLTCHGRYEPQLPDGTLYFHRCPPLSGAALKAAIDAGTVTLPPGAAARLQAARAADAQAPATGDQVSNVDTVLASISVDRPNTRDENVTGGRDPNTAPTIKADGLGVRAVS